MRREGSVRSAALGATPPAFAERAAPAWWRWVPSRVATFCLVELQKLSHDRTELFTRAVQPVLWMLIFGETSTACTRSRPADSPIWTSWRRGSSPSRASFVSIFYGIQIIWERDAGVLTKLLVTPTPRCALIIGKGFAAGIRSLAQVVVVLVLSAILGVTLSTNPLHILAALLIVMLGSAFFACLSMTIAGGGCSGATA